MARTKGTRNTLGWAAAIMSQVGDAMQAWQTARFTFGAAFVALTDAENAPAALAYLGIDEPPEQAGSLSMARAAEALHARFPDAEARTGYAFTVANLKRYRDAYLAFASEGGQRHGHHNVTDDDVALLDLTPAEQGELASAMASGDVRVRDVAKQAARVRRDPKVRAKATDVVRQRLQRAQREPTVDERIAAAEREVAKRERALQAARDELARLQAERDGQQGHTNRQPQTGQQAVSA